MRKYILLVAFCVVPFLASCVTTSCPPEDAVIFLQSPYDGVPVVIPKDAFSTDDAWMTIEEFEEYMRSQQGDSI